MRAPARTEWRGTAPTDSGRRAAARRALRRRRRDAPGPRRSGHARAAAAGERRGAGGSPGNGRRLRPRQVPPGCRRELAAQIERAPGEILVHVAVEAAVNLRPPVGRIRPAAPWGARTLASTRTRRLRWSEGRDRAPGPPRIGRGGARHRAPSQDRPATAVPAGPLGGRRPASEGRLDPQWSERALQERSVHGGAASERPAWPLPQADSHGNGRGRPPWPYGARSATGPRPTVSRGVSGAAPASSASPGQPRAVGRRPYAHSSLRRESTVDRTPPEDPLCLLPEDETAGKPGQYSSAWTRRVSHPGPRLRPPLKRSLSTRPRPDAGARRSEDRIARPWRTGPRRAPRARATSDRECSTDGRRYA
jgi:hypothetical protein